MTTFVLVHGAWHSGQSWSRVVPLLGASGHRVFTPTLTGYGETRHLMGPDVGLDTHVADVVRLLERENLTDVILVGHSYAGLVVSSVANQIPSRIARIVYLDAMVPEHGESAVDVIPMSQVLIDAALQSDSGWRVPPMPEFPLPYGLFGVTDLANVAWLRTMLSDQSVLSLQQSASLDNPAARTIPRTHIHCTVKPGHIDSRPVAETQPNGQPSEVWELPTGHDCMITMPDELAALLLK